MDVRFMSIPVNSSVSNGSYILQSIVGKVAFLFFTVQNSNALVNDNMFSYNKVASFNLLDGTGQNIVGGGQITDEQSQLLFGKWWSTSSYLTETSLGITNNGANVLIYSFCESPELALSGVESGFQEFRGNETLNVWFPVATSSACVLNVYAYVYSIHQTSANGVRKIA